MNQLMKVLVMAGLLFVSRNAGAVSVESLEVRVAKLEGRDWSGKKELLGQCTAMEERGAQKQAFPRHEAHADFVCRAGVKDL